MHSVQDGSDSGSDSESETDTTHTVEPCHDRPLPKKNTNQTAAKKLIQGEVNS